MLNKKEQRLRRSRQTRARIALQRVARLTVFRSNLHIYASVISEDGQRVLASASTAEKEVREQLGQGPVYLSFDIDGLDPSSAPGTGTPEIGGLTTIQGIEIIRGCRGLQLVGCDLVEVSPPYDPTGNTALLAANLLYEMLCVLPGVKYRN